MRESKIGSISLQELIHNFRYDLYEDFLPFMDRYVVDHETGGFMTNVQADGTRVSARKLIWQQGRGIWVYSFLFRNLSHDPKHLAIAAKGVDFVLSVCPLDASNWPDMVCRTGEVLTRDEGMGIYDKLFVAEGLAEFSQASGNQHYWDAAKSLLLNSVSEHERDDFPVDTSSYFDIKAQFNPWEPPQCPVSPAPFAGGRSQGAAMCMLRLATQMLRSRPDPDLELIAANAIKTAVEKHWNSAFNLNVELLNHDYSLPNNEYRRLVYPAHTIEVMWMVMDEALRRMDEGLFNLAAERFRRHAEVAWDDVYEGYFMGARDVDANLWQLDKALWAQQEVLVGCLMLVEHGNDFWAHSTYDRTYQYLQEKFALRRRGLPMYMFASDRKASFEESHYAIVENYHHPRWLMLNLLAFERMAVENS